MTVLPFHPNYSSAVQTVWNMTYQALWDAAHLPTPILKTLFVGYLVVSLDLWFICRVRSINYPSWCWAFARSEDPQVLIDVVQWGENSGWRVAYTALFDRGAVSARLSREDRYFPFFVAGRIGLVLGV